jgi:phosphoribosylformylglycinamidine cyclo-ligase
MQDPIMVSGTDGVGTKLKVAQLLDKHDTVGIDLVAMCVNDILACGAEPLFFLDYVAAGKIEREHIAKIVGGIAEGCRQSNCALIGGEMAEHPGVMDPTDYDLSGFTVGVVDRPKMIGPDKVQEGDVVVGLASTGFHSNGYSLVRKVLVEGKTAEELSVPRDDLNGATLGEALLAPTRIYVKSVLATLREMPEAVHALAHITGGGMTENLNRALPDNMDALVDRTTWDVPPVTALAVAEAGLTKAEAYKTFNMGIGMALIVAPSQVDVVREALEEMGEKTYVIGSIIPGTGVVKYADED